MSKVNTSEIEEVETQAHQIPWEEQFEDHENKIEEYIQNCIFRGCSVEGTVRRKAELQTIFRRLEIADSTHPAGRRHLIVWDLLNPSRGSHYVNLIVSSLLKDDVAPGTRRKYMSALRWFCDYVVAKPNLPGSSRVSLPEKYGPLVTSLTKYDLPIHAADRPRKKRYALAPELRDDFFEFLRLEYLRNHPQPHVAARNYTAIIFQAEIGARSSELLAIRSKGESSDIDEVNGRIRLFGKGKPYSGKRLRFVPLTPLASEVLSPFQKFFKPLFPKSPDSDYLFLSKNGVRLTSFAYWKMFQRIVKRAIEFGLPLPKDVRPHDLRRTFATNEYQKNPLAYRKVLKHLGHSYPSSAAPYLIATDEDVEEQQGDLIDIFIDPYIEIRRKN
jgi:integrase